MRHIWKPIIFIILMVPALNATAVMNKCTDANGNVTYTNIACPPGNELTKSIADNLIVISGNPEFSQQELDQMLAPIALYPDSLLSQILMAATYPLEVVEAARWSRANPLLDASASVQAVDNRNWDPSIKSLAAFPQVLQTLDQKIEWTERLGDAFLAQQSQVMDTVQKLRQKAQAADNLISNPEIQVTHSDGNIEVTDANPDVVYVPYYNPDTVYGTWWWPNYPPVYWAPWNGYGWHGGFAWGAGIGIGGNFFFGSCDWRNHGVYIHNPRYPGNGHPWQHDSGHRHGVPYREASLNRRFGRIATAASRAYFRGYESSVNTRPGKSGNRLPMESFRRAAQAQTRARILQRNVSHQSYNERRAHAFENIGRGPDVRNFSERGYASWSGRFSAPSRGSSGMGGR